MRSGCKAALTVAALVSLSGCAAWKVNQLASALPAMGPVQTLAKLDAINAPDRDRVQFLLNRGVLKFYTGDFGGSREDLQSAKGMMESLDAVSVTENLAAATTNETLRTYTGGATDRVLVHVVLLLGYLLEGDLDGARVEALQADITMRHFDGEEAYGQFAVARFLAGLIFEISGERDDALISYRKSYQILSERREPVPPALQLSLLNLTRSQGFDQEYAKYRQQFHRDAEIARAGENNWVVIYFDGIVSQKTQTHLSVFNNDLNTLISVVMPYYPGAGGSPSPVSWQIDNAAQGVEAIENLDRRVREDLAQDRAAILAAATVRAVAKYQMVQQARERSELAAVLTNIATVASEQADLRSWNMLPAFIQVGRVTAPADSEISLPIKQFHDRQAHNPSGDFVVLFAYSYSPDVFTYPPGNKPSPDTEPAEP